MAFSTGKSSISLAEIQSKVNEAKLVSLYLGVYEVPCVISSPLREDRRPSFGLYSNDGKRIYWVDLATKDRGGIYDLLGLMWHCSFKEVLSRINKDIYKFSNGATVDNYVPCDIRNATIYGSNSKLECKIREWAQHDVEYWASYGISIDWLKYAEVYPISHKIITNEKGRFVLGADKYAYAYVEHKEGKVTLKIYQPFNKNGYKWANKHDGSIISLWTKVPEYGDKVVICSSLKDALCLWANTGIPALAIQGEGYNMSDTAISELKRRFKNVYILFDNDEAGLENGIKLFRQTGFNNIVLPKFEGGKDISDMYKSFGKERFTNAILSLFEKYDKNNIAYSLPF